MKNGINKITLFSLIINIILLILVFILIFTTGNSFANYDNNEPRHGTILLNFDQRDLEQLDNLVARFNEGKRKYLMLIPPIIDGGYSIHDVRSNGYTITWSIDNTRDALSGKREVRSYECKSIHKDDTEEYYLIELSNCEGFSPDEKIHAFSIRKDIEE